MTVIEYVPAGVVAETETVNVDVAETVAVVNTMLFGLASALIPDGPDTDSEMVAEKPFKPSRVIVEVPEDPARIDIEGLAVTVKSTTLTVTSTEWERVLLVAVTFRVYVPYLVAVTVRTADVVLPGVRLTVWVVGVDVSPVLGDAVSVMVPENPLRLERLTSDVAGIPAEVVIDGWPVVILKSTTFTVTVIE